MEHFSYTPPSQIEGEPEEVEALVIQQLASLGALMAEIVRDSYVQLRAATVLEYDTLEDWQASERGVAAELLRIRSVNWLKAASALHTP